MPARRTMRPGGLQPLAAASWGSQRRPSAFRTRYRSVTAPLRRFTGRGCNSAVISAGHPDIRMYGLSGSVVTVLLYSKLSFAGVETARTYATYIKSSYGVGIGVKLGVH